MKKEKNKKSKKNIYILGLFFIFASLSLINFKEAKFFKKITMHHNDDKAIENINLSLSDSEIKEDKFMISFNKEDLIENQQSISAEDAGEKF
jgi:hypothetical protein